MNIAVRYFSRGGNTKKVAEAIANAVGASAKDCSAPVNGTVDLLFLGGSVYGFGLDERLTNYISGLDPVNVKRAAVFGTSAIVKTGNGEIAKLLQEKGITVMQEGFYCRGAFAVMHRGHPNSDDLEKAAVYARAAADSLQ